MHTQDYRGNATAEYIEFRKASEKREPLSDNSSNLHPNFKAHKSKRISANFDNGSLFSDGSKVPYGQSYANADIYRRLDHTKLRRAARNAFHDSSIARGIGERFTNLVVDTGLTLSFTPDDTILNVNLDKKQDEIREWNRRFHIWANSKNVTLNRSMSLYQLQRFIVFSQQRDNDYFVRVHYNLDDSDQVELEVIDPDSIYGSYNPNEKYNPNRQIKDGIEYDQNGREIAYYVNVVRNGESKRVRIEAFDPNTGLPYMIHGFKAEYANQKRGLPFITNIINDCENFKTFTISQIKTAIIQSVIAMYVKPSQSNDAGSPLEAALQGQLRSGLSSDDIDALVEDNYSDDLVYEAMPEVNMIPGGVGLFSLKAGEDLKAFEPKVPSQDFDRFSDSFIAQLSCAVSMPPEILMQKFGENYSASRAAIVMAFRMGLIYAQELFTDFLNPLKEIWTTIEIAKGRISMPGFSDRVLKQAWLNCDWIGPPMIDIDPEKSSRAAGNYIKLGATTYDRVAKDKNGSSFASNAKQLNREVELLPNSSFENKGKE
jgi:lambda family phage portal protein